MFGLEADGTTAAAKADLGAGTVRPEVFGAKATAEDTAGGAVDRYTMEEEAVLAQQ